MVVYEGGGEDGEAAVRRMHFELFQEVLYLMERRIYGAQRKASPAFAAAAALFVAVEGRVSLWWAMEHAPLGQVSYSDSTRDRLKRLIRIAQRLQAELQLCPVPRATDPSLPQEQWSVVRTAAWQLVQQMPVAPAFVLASDSAEADEIRPLSSPQTPSPILQSPPTLLLPSPPSPPSPPPMPPVLPAAPVPSWPEKGVRFLMMQYLQLKDSAAVPPEFFGLETGGKLFAAARAVVNGISREIFPATRTCQATVILIWGDPGRKTLLDSFEDVVPAGVAWHKLEKKHMVDLRWVHARDANAASLYWHDKPEPMFVFHTLPGKRQLVLDIVKANNFLDIYPPHSAERAATAKWEAAVKVGTIEALLAVQLNDDYTLEQALAEGVKGYDNRHGTMHVKWQVQCPAVLCYHCLCRHSHYRRHRSHHRTTAPHAMPHHPPHRPLFCHTPAHSPLCTHLTHTLQPRVRFTRTIVLSMLTPMMDVTSRDKARGATPCRRGAPSFASSKISHHSQQNSTSSRCRPTSA